MAVSTKDWGKRVLMPLPANFFQDRQRNPLIPGANDVPQQANPLAPPPATMAPAPAPAPAAPAAPVKQMAPDLSPKHLRRRIEAAYLTASGGQKNTGVGLHHIRKQMPDIGRKDMDAAFGRVLRGDNEGNGAAFLMRHDDPRQISPEMHDAAYKPAGEPFHVMWLSG